MIDGFGAWGCNTDMWAFYTVSEVSDITSTRASVSEVCFTNMLIHHYERGDLEDYLCVNNPNIAEVYSCGASRSPQR